MANNPFKKRESEKEKKASDNPFTKRDLEEEPAFGMALSRTFVNNLLALPKLGGAALSGGAAGLRGIFEDDSTFSERYAEEQEKFPASLFNKLGSADVDEVGAFIRSLPAALDGSIEPTETYAGYMFEREFGGDQEPFSERYQRELGQFRDEAAAIEEANPFAWGAGEIGGDILSLITGRAPLAGKIQEYEKVLEIPLKLAKDPGAARWAQRTLNHPAVRALARGTGRSLETGAEAMVLDIIKGDDPLETAALAAGTQAAGSMMNTLSKGLLSGGPLKAGAKITLTALSTAGLLQIAKDVTPGGEDNFLDSLELSYEKIALAFLAGAVASAAGTGRARDTKFAEDWPKLMDAIATTPRGAVLSIMEDFVNGSKVEKEKIEMVLNQVAENPEYFGESADELQQALEKGDLLRTIQNLEKRSETFQEDLYDLMFPEG